MRKAYYMLATLLVTSLSVELVARYFGLHQVPLFEKNDHYEYIHKPNQNTVIYRNKFSTNEFSMRCAPIGRSDTLVVLLIGDSVINGTNQVDQDDLASTLLEKKLKKSFNRAIRVLNISSYTWGPDNVYAYLQQHGLFSADLIVMVNNSADAYDNMTFTNVVGVSEKMPAENYSVASCKLVEKIYASAKLLFSNSINRIQQNENKEFNTGFKNIYTLAITSHIPLLVYLHSSQTEIEEGCYNEDGQKIISFFKSHNVNVINELAYAVNERLYLDDIHFNKQGQYFMSQLLYPAIYNQLMSNKKTALFKNV